jgi:hypothetical protein
MLDQNIVNQLHQIYKAKPSFPDRRAIFSQYLHNPIIAANIGAWLEGYLDWDSTLNAMITQLWDIVAELKRRNDLLPDFKSSEKPLPSFLLDRDKLPDLNESIKIKAILDLAHEVIFWEQILVSKHKSSTTIFSDAFFGDKK